MGASEEKAWIKQYASWTDPHPAIGNDTLVSWFNQVVATQPKSTATWFMGKELTYAQLNGQVGRAAAALTSLGVRAGDRVALALPNCPQHIVAMTAILRLGAVVVEHNPLYTAYELEHQFNDHGAKLAIVFDVRADTFTDLIGTTPLEQVVSVNMTEEMPFALRTALKIPVPPLAKKRAQLTKDAPGTLPWRKFMQLSSKTVHFPPISQADTAVILYTSGTSGKPKGAPLTHGNIVSVIRAGLEWLEDWGAVREKVLGVLPLFHIYGLALNYTLPLTIGAQMVLVPAPQPELYQAAITKTRPTVLPGVPTLYDKIIDWAEKTKADLSSIHTSISGASTLPAPTIERWEQVTGGRLIEGYGLTETAPILVGNPLDLSLIHI